MINTMFAKYNKRFWSKFKEPESGKLVLVETSTHPVINHSNAVVAKMIAQAKNLRIAWITDRNTKRELMKSYSPGSLFIKTPKINILCKLYFFTHAFLYYFKYVFLTNNLLSFNYKRIPYGDFVYDIYLAKYSMATLHRFDFRIIMAFYALLLNDNKARLVLNKYPIEAILVSHYIGLNTGPLSRVALQKKVPVYWKGGGHEIINLSVFKKLNQIYDYPKRPSIKTVDLLAKKYKKKIEFDFDKFVKDSQNSPFHNAFSVAYNNKISSKIDRKKFLNKMKLNDKKIVFVMLHAFNDFPHSHFKEMLFNDYYDWFRQTLNFAKNDKSKNWVFKEHPANKFYTTKDLNLNKLMRNLPEHIRFVSQNSDIKASVVLNVADMIVTCLGTAGLEMPALKGIPSIVAGDTFYDGFGFTLDPRSKKEYFHILKEFVPKRLSFQQQLKAKCTYLYLQKYCIAPFAAGPATTFIENNKPERLKGKYFKRTLKTYRKKQKQISKQFNEYVRKIKNKNFKCLNTLPN